MSLAIERTEIVRSAEFRASEDANGQTLEGYAAVFNTWTDIRDSQGSYKERIAAGAFKRSIGQRTPVLQFDHGTHPFLGSLPLGTISVLREDRNGLYVKARLSDNWLIQPVRDAITDRAVTGMSFRFRVVADQWATDAEGNDTRTLKEVEVLELGPVVFPAYEQTSVDVRSLIGALDDETRAELARELVVALNPAENRGEGDDIQEEPPPDAPAAIALQPDEVFIGRDRSTTKKFRAEDISKYSTSPVAGEPASDDAPDEPRVASHDNHTQIAAALKAFRQTNQREKN